MVAAAAERGWTRFAPDPRIRAWAEAAHRAALAVVADPQMRAEWLQCEGTWFVGVDALPTAPDGSIDGTPLRGAVIDALAPLPSLHPAQLFGRDPDRLEQTGHAQNCRAGAQHRGKQDRPENRPAPRTQPGHRAGKGEDRQVDRNEAQQEDAQDVVAGKHPPGGTIEPHRKWPP